MNTSLFRFVGLGFSLGLVWAAQGCQTTMPEHLPEASIQVVSEIDAGAQAVATRASTITYASKSAFVALDQIGVWAVPYLNSESTKLVAAPWQAKDNYADNVAFVSNGAVFAPAAGKEIYFPSPLSLVDLYSVYPYDVQMSDPTNNSMPTPTAFEFTITQAQLLASNVVASDLMSAKTPAAKQGTSAVMTFTHRLSRALVTFTVPANYRKNSVNGVSKVELCNIPLKAVVNLADKTVAAKAVTTNNPGVNISAYQAGKPNGGAIPGEYTYEAIVMPGTVVASGSTIVRITLDVDQIGLIPLDCKVSSSFTYVASEVTHIVVAVNDDTEITLPDANVTIAAWGNTTPPIVETVKPARMILDVAVNGNESKAADVKSATLTIDAQTYTQVAATYHPTTKTITIEYPQSTSIWGYELTSIALHNAAGTTLGVVYTPTPSGVAAVPIPGKPTDEGYNTKIGITAAFN